MRIRRVRQSVIEIATAAGIFLAANGVFGLDLVLGRNLASAQTYVGGTTFTVRIEETADITIPKNIIVGQDGNVDIWESLCIDSSSGRHPHRLHVGPVDAPWQVSLHSKQQFIPACNGDDNVLLNIIGYEDGESSLQNKAQSDTITLFVRPE
ncbi:MAG: hypothetical protein HUJ31_19685 [Pseudomonadales bacterium]|nr:hypothetical protein [Pseudomonadales bacterium]